ncbi:hypothetical protein [Lacticaseibacillus paracasei]|uniref:hypothetical protein n=1 Tax=Lacticaseibacillus paracasei TaxID=1597 RepID=UPI00039CB539|nr:hypothetical protein [Lacticaseibacillus paracasei]
MGKMLNARPMLKDIGFAKSVSEKNMAVLFILAATKVTKNMSWTQVTNYGVQIHEGWYS